MNIVKFLYMTVMFATLAGCAASYATPSRGADLSAIGVAKNSLTNMPDPSVEEMLDKKPLAQFPTAIAVARIESPDYHSATNAGWGTGRYSVVTTRDVEDPNVIEQWQKLPDVLGIAPLNRLLLPYDLNSDLELRRAAAQLHADVLLVYTIDTAFTSNDLASPLTLVTLGLAPDQKIHVVSTASAVLMDTRNGYIYGLCEASDQKDGLTIEWTTDSAIDQVRRQTEAAAFRKMGEQFQVTWTKIAAANNRAATRPI